MISTEHGAQTAFELLLEEVEQVADGLNREGAAAFEQGRHKDVANLLEQAKHCAELQRKVRALREEWEKFCPTPAPTPAPTPGVSRRDLGRLNKGLRTPDKLFRLPLLQALVELGGKAPIHAATDRVGEKMKSILNEYDHEPLPSDPNMPRWRNTVAWMRHTLVTEGFLRKDSPRGIWELTDSGKAASKEL
jgi:restriction system protein